MAEPVSLDTAKQHIGLLDDTSRDDLIAGYIKAAREWVENYTGHILVQREVTDEHEGFGAFFDLMKRPFDPETVTITYTDADGVAQTVSDVTVSGRRVRPAFNAWWPSTRPYTAVNVTYTAGYAEGEVPQSLIQAMLLLVGHFWVNREAVSERQSNEVPFAVTALCDPYRAVSL